MLTVGHPSVCLFEHPVCSWSVQQWMFFYCCFLSVAVYGHFVLVFIINHIFNLSAYPPVAGGAETEDKAEEKGGHQSFQRKKGKETFIQSCGLLVFPGKNVQSKMKGLLCSNKNWLQAVTNINTTMMHYINDKYIIWKWFNFVALHFRKNLYPRPLKCTVIFVHFFLTKSAYCMSKKFWRILYTNLLAI